MADHEPVQNLWLSQPRENFTMSTEEIRSRASRLHANVSARNTREYVVGALLIIIFGYFAWTSKTLFEQLALALTVVGIGVTLWGLHRQARTAGSDEIFMVTNWSDFYRMQLVRQRDALRRIWTWYLGPLLPGLVMFWIAAGSKFLASGNLLMGGSIILVGLAVTAIVFGSIAAANRKAADQLQEEIDALERLMSE